jgi:hypothetical protein
MIKLSHDQIDVIRFSQELSSSVLAYLGDPTLASKARNQLSANDCDYLHDACVDALPIKAARQRTRSEIIGQWQEIVGPQTDQPERVG